MKRVKMKVYTPEAIKELVEENSRLTEQLKYVKEGKAYLDSLASDRAEALEDHKATIKSLRNELHDTRQAVVMEKDYRRQELLDIIRWQINPDTAVNNGPDRISGGGWRG